MSPEKRGFEPTLDLDGPLKRLDEIACETADLVEALKIKLEEPGGHTLLRGILLATFQKVREDPELELLEEQKVRERLTPKPPARSS